MSMVSIARPRRSRMGRTSGGGGAKGVDRVAGSLEEEERERTGAAQERSDFFSEGMIGGDCGLMLQTTQGFFCKTGAATSFHGRREY